MTAELRLDGFLVEAEKTYESAAILALGQAIMLAREAVELLRRQAEWKHQPSCKLIVERDCSCGLFELNRQICSFLDGAG